MAFIRHLENIRANDYPTVGGKAANLGELSALGFCVPQGFAIPASTFDAFLGEDQLRRILHGIWPKMSGLSREQLKEASEAITSSIESHDGPPLIWEEILSGFDTLEIRSGAVRSSATLEDSKATSFAGSLSSFLNVKREDLAHNIKLCWSSLFSARNLSYIVARQIDPTCAGMGVIVQRMISPDVAGVCFTANPVTGARSELIIEAAWGLGEAIVSGSIIPDHYVIAKTSTEVIDELVSCQTFKLVATDNGIEALSVEAGLSNAPKLTKDNLSALTSAALLVEQHYGFPQDLEFAFLKDQLFLLQTRPITTISGS